LVKIKSPFQAKERLVKSKRLIGVVALLFGVMSSLSLNLNSCKRCGKEDAINRDADKAAADKAAADKAAKEAADKEAADKAAAAQAEQERNAKEAADAEEEQRRKQQEEEQRKKAGIVEKLVRAESHIRDMCDKEEISKRLSYLAQSARDALAMGVTSLNAGKGIYDNILMNIQRESVNLHQMVNHAKAIFDDAVKDAAAYPTDGDVQKAMKPLQDAVNLRIPILVSKRGIALDRWKDMAMAWDCFAEQLIAKRNGDSWHLDAMTAYSYEAKSYAFASMWGKKNGDDSKSNLLAQSREATSKTKFMCQYAPTPSRQYSNEWSDFVSYMKALELDSNYWNIPLTSDEWRKTLQ
jgi:hypothetical protein